MFHLEQKNVEKILCTLDERGYLFPEFQFNKVGEKLQLLGRGGFSTVYEMADKNTMCHHYAVKVIGFEKHSVTLEHFWNTVRWQREIGAQSPYVVRILDERALQIALDENGEVVSVSDDESERWSGNGLHLQMILMEKLEDIIEKDKLGKPSLVREELQNERDVLEFAVQIGQALLLAHNSRILHRDIKIENIFWDEKEKKYKLGDFGNARYVEDGNAETVVYTDGYGAPELQCRLGNFYNATADIYSFGMVLYLLLNKLQFPGSDGYVTNRVQYNPDFVFPAPIHASEQMTRVIRKMCSYRKEDRYQSMAEVLMDLKCVSDQYGMPDENKYWNEVELVTETYHEQNTETDEQVHEENTEKTRIDRKLEHIQKNTAYNKGCFWFFLGFTVLSVLFMTNMQTDVTMLTSWQFWLLPILLLIESVLQRVKDFRFLFGIATLGFGIYAINTIGFTVPHVMMMLCMLFGIPILTASGAVAVGCWMVLNVTGKIQILNFVRNHDVGWIILILMMMILARFARFRATCDKVEPDLNFAESFCILSSLVMTVAGIIIVILEFFKVVQLPEVLEKMHFFRTGFILFWILSIMLGSDENEIDERKEYVD